MAHMFDIHILLYVTSSIALSLFDVKGSYTPTIFSSVWYVLGKLQENKMKRHECKFPRTGLVDHHKY